MNQARQDAASQSSSPNHHLQLHLRACLYVQQGAGPPLWKVLAPPAHGVGTATGGLWELPKGCTSPSLGSQESLSSPPIPPGPNIQFSLILERAHPEGPRPLEPASQRKQGLTPEEQGPRTSFPVGIRDFPEGSGPPEPAWGLPSGARASPVCTPQPIPSPRSLPLTMGLSGLGLPHPEPALRITWDLQGPPLDRPSATGRAALRDCGQAEAEAGGSSAREGGS